MRYSNFFLHIGRPAEGVYPVSVVSPAGAGTGSFRIPFAAGEIHPGTFFSSGESGREIRPADERDLHAPEDIGGRLFSALFSGDVGKLFERSFAGIERARDRGLRIQILIDPETTSSALQVLPWELLFWTERRSFLSLSRKSPVIRSLRLPRPFTSRNIDPPLRILVVMADPAGLDLEAERNALQQTLGEVSGIEVSFLETATREEMSRYLREYPHFHVLHYMGHGEFEAKTGEGGLRLAGEDGYTPGPALAQIFGEAPSLRLAVLNGCHTARSSETVAGDPFAGVAPALLLAGLPAVVAMQYRISDRAAIEFTKAFYSGLASGESVELAVRNGRQGVYSVEPQRPEWALPVLFLGGKNGRLFAPSKMQGKRSPDPLRTHLHRVVKRLGRLNPPGIPRQGRAPSVLLDSIIVPLRCRRFDPFPSTRTPPHSLQGTTGALTPFGRDLRIVILGGPGSGKTTLLQWIALQHASARLRNEPRLRLSSPWMEPGPATAEVDAGPSRVPVLIRLTEYNAARRQAPSLSLSDFLSQQSPGLIESGRPQQIPVLVLLDGLDEIAEPGERYDTAREIDCFLEDCPREWNGSLQVVVTSRLAGYGAAPLGQDFSHWLLEPLDATAIHLLVAAWGRALESEEEALAMPAPDPPFPDGEALSANPQLVTLWAILSHQDPGSTPHSRIQLYEAAVDLWIEDWRRRCELDGVSRRDLLAILSEWVADNDMSIEATNLAGRLRRELPADKAEIASSALNEKNQSGGLLHPAFREYLAACWLASDPDQFPHRLLEKLGESRWREPLRMALARLSADRTPQDLEKALLLFLSLDGPSVGLLPRTVALLVAAMSEMVQVPEKVIEEAAGRLIGAWAERARSGGPPALLHLLEKTFSRLVSQAASAPLERALRRALDGDSLDRCLAAAHLSRIAICASVEIAEALTAALARDSEEWGWPVDAALRDLARRRPDLLPSRPGTFRQELRRRAALRQLLDEDPGWRRVALALYGDARDPERMHRDSALTPGLLSLLEASSGEPLASSLWKAATSSSEEIRRDALLALMAAGEPVETELRKTDPGARRALAHLSRIARALETSIPESLSPFLTSLERDGGSWLRERQGCDLVSAVIDVTLAFGGAPVQILPLAKAASTETRPRLLAEVWTCLVAGAHGDPAYNLAVLLDTEGEALTSPPSLLAETLALAPLSANARWDRHRAWMSDHQTPRPREGDSGLLASALDSIAGLTPAFDFVRSWALIVLAPLLRKAGLNVEALILALWSLTDRFDARNEAVQALAGSESIARSLLNADPGPALLAAVREMTDPFRRLRALLCLAQARPDIRDELLAQPAPADRPWAWIARLFRPRADLPGFVREILAHPEPAQRTWALESLATLDETQPSRWISLAIRSARSIQDPEEGGQMLLRLAPHLPPGRRGRLLRQALRRAVQISAPERRAEVLATLRPRLAISPALRAAFERAVASLEGAQNRARARGPAAPLLLKAEPVLGETATPLALGAILNDLRRELALPTDLPGLWAALVDGARRGAARAALHDLGRSEGLRLTSEAAESLDSLVTEGDLETVTALQPLLEAPEPSALPVIHRWLEQPDPRLRSTSSLLLAERHGASARTVRGLLALLTDPDDRSRYRAALALHGDFSPGRQCLSAAKMGATALEELASFWLQQRDRAPGIAKTVAWTFERIDHDDPRSIEIWTARLSKGKTGAREAEVILGAIEHLHPVAETAFIRGLQDGSPLAQRALLRSTCRLLSRGRLRDDLWARIASCLSQLPSDAGEDSVLTDSPTCLINAVREAHQIAGKATSHEIAALADRSLAPRISRLSEAFRPDADVREELLRAGRTSRLSGPGIRAAADQIVASPELLRSLLAWLCARLGRDVQDAGPFCPINSDLLALAAAAMDRLPEAFQEATSALPELRSRLCDAVCFHDSFPGRRDALRLLALQRRLTLDVLKALKSALCDVPPVQAAAMDSLVLYREADPEVLPLLLMGLADPSPQIAMASGRLLGILARNGGLSTSERADAQRALATANFSRRDLYAMSATPPLKIVHAGRLDEILFESLADIEGFTDILGPDAVPQSKETL